MADLKNPDVLIAFLYTVDYSLIFMTYHSVEDLVMFVGVKNTHQWNSGVFSSIL